MPICPYCPDGSMPADVTALPLKKRKGKKEINPANRHCLLQNTALTVKGHRAPGFKSLFMGNVVQSRGVSTAWTQLLYEAI